MKSNYPPNTPAANRARRGIIAIATTTTLVPNLRGPVEYRRRCEIVTVTSVSRGGWVLRYRTAWGNEVDLRRFGPANRPTLVLASDVDTAAAEAVAKAHHWPGHPDQPQAFDSLAAIREALAPLRPANA